MRTLVTTGTDPPWVAEFRAAYAVRVELLAAPLSISANVSLELDSREPINAHLIEVEF